MKIALLANHYDQAHLEEVKAQMITLGAPKIKATWIECQGVWAALEGCHRIRAAKELDLEIIIEPIEYSDEITSADLGLDLQEICTVADICDEAYLKTVISF